MPHLQHIALKTEDLELIRAFYKDVLGLEEANYNADIGRLWLSLEDGFTLIFDRTEEEMTDSSLTYLGLELPDFAAVDAMFKQVSAHASVEKDMREQYRHAQGPYGFFVRDPNGYRIKVFKYNYVKEGMKG